MTPTEAADLIRPALPEAPGSWADLGAGTGLFTRALAAVLAPGSTVVAVDRDAAALRSVPEAASGVALRTLVGDVRDLDRLGDLPPRLDGALLANVLHFAPEAAVVLRAVAGRLRPGGRVVIVEYDRDRGSRWVPHPIPRRSLGVLGAAAGLTPFEVVGTRPSRFGGDLYAAVARLGEGGSVPGRGRGVP